jgi:hypothetical protein
LSQKEPAVVVQKACDCALWIIPKLEEFPKAYRFSIIQNVVAASNRIKHPSTSMRSVAPVFSGPLGGSRFPPRRFRECQLRFGAWIPAVNGVKQQADPGFLVSHLE